MFITLLGKTNQTEIERTFDTGKFHRRRIGLNVYADFETLNLFISLKFESNVYLLLQGLSYRVLSEPGKNFDNLVHVTCCLLGRKT